VIKFEKKETENDKKYVTNGGNQGVIKYKNFNIRIHVYQGG
jgi:hypothetical protein